MSSSQIEYLVVKWTKDKSISMIHESDIVMKSPNAVIAVDTKLSAWYEGKVLDAVVLHCGEFDEMDRVFRGMQPNADRETDSPKGRGHRMPKRRVHPDFATDEEISDGADPPKKKRDVHKVSVAASGQDVIDKLLNDHQGTIFNVDHIDFDGEVQRLRDDLAAANQKIAALERQNEILRSRLPAVLAKLENYVDQLHSVKLPSTPKYQKTPQPEQQQNFSGLPVKLPTTPRYQKLPQPEQKENFSPSELGQPDTPSPPKSRPPTDITNDIVANEFEISQEILRRVSQAKGKSKLVCNLLRALFTREELATSSLKGKGQKGENRVLDVAKVEALTAYVLSTYSDADRSFVRLKITEKLNDERKAFLKENKGG